MSGGILRCAGRRATSRCILTYETLADCMEMSSDWQMEYREQAIVFRRNDITISHELSPTWTSKNRQARLIFLLTNDFDMFPKTVVNIYRLRWQIESAFQTDKAELAAALFLWREYKCHQEQTLVHTDSKHAVILASKFIGA